MKDISAKARSTRPKCIKCIDSVAKRIGVLDRKVEKNPDLHLKLGERGKLNPALLSPSAARLGVGLPANATDGGAPPRHHEQSWQHAGRQRQRGRFRSGYGPRRNGCGNVAC